MKNTNTYKHMQRQPNKQIRKKRSKQNNQKHIEINKNNTQTDKNPKNTNTYNMRTKMHTKHI